MSRDLGDMGVGGAGLEPARLAPASRRRCPLRACDREFPLCVRPRLIRLCLRPSRAHPLNMPWNRNVRPSGSVNVKARILGRAGGHADLREAGRAALAQVVPECAYIAHEEAQLDGARDLLATLAAMARSQRRAARLSGRVRRSAATAAGSSGSVRRLGSCGQRDWRPGSPHRTSVSPPHRGRPG